MRLMWSWRTVIVSALVVFLSSLVWPGPAHAVTTFGGEATGVWVFVPATGLIIKVTTGQIPASGGEVEASLLSGTFPVVPPAGPFRSPRGRCTVGEGGWMIRTRSPHTPTPNRRAPATGSPQTS